MIDSMPTLDDLRRAVENDERANREIAKAAGIHETTFSAFMHGRGLSIETAERLAVALGLKLKLVKTRK